MTPEVKQRIEQIRQGIVPEGYKKGKIGIVPIKWNKVPFSTLFTSTSEYTDDLKQYPLYSLTIEDGITAKTERYERSHLVKKENSYKVVRPNDYAYNPMNIRFGAVARHKGDIPVAVSGYYDIFTTVHESDLVFMDSFLTYGPMITYYNKVSTGSLVEKQRVHFSDFLEFSLALPPLEERKKIAEILSTQDKAIELQGRKIEELKRFKKGCLEKMFPRKGQKVPEKRFPGFTDDWEQRKVGDITIESTEYLTLDSGLPLFTSSRNGLLYQNEYRGNVTTNNKQTLFSVVPLGACTYRHMSDDDVFHLNINTIEKGLVSREYPVFCGTPNHDIVFIVQHINSSKAFRAFCAEQKMGGTRTRLYYKALCEFTMMVPSFAEQRRISKFLLTIDHLITLHQRKLEEMKRQKKALMQLLLTGIVRVRL